MLFFVLHFYFLFVSFLSMSHNLVVNFFASSSDISPVLISLRKIAGSSDLSKEDSSPLLLKRNFRSS